MSMPLIYSLIILWFFEENKKGKVILKDRLQFLNMITHPTLDLVEGRAASFNIYQRWNQVNWRLLPYEFQCIFIQYLTYCICLQIVYSMLNSKSRKNIFHLSSYHFLLTSYFDTILLQKMLLGNSKWCHCLRVQGLKGQWHFCWEWQSSAALTELLLPLSLSPPPPPHFPFPGTIELLPSLHPQGDAPKCNLLPQSQILFTQV